MGLLKEKYWKKKKLQLVTKSLKKNPKTLEKE